jgi:small subunit ribosomal protein S27e
MDLVPNPNSKFLRVKCQNCESESIIFNHAKTIVECTNDDCNTILAEPSGGKAQVHAEILETLS